MIKYRKRREKHKIMNRINKEDRDRAKVWFITISLSLVILLSLAIYLSYRVSESNQTVESQVVSD